MENVISIIIAVVIAVIIALFEKKSKRKSVSAVPKLDFIDSENITGKAKDKIDIPPVPQVTPIVLPEEGQRVSVDLPQIDLQKELEEKEKKAGEYRARWRKAIIDAEILQPKFKS